MKHRSLTFATLTFVAAPAAAALPFLASCSAESPADSSNMSGAPSAGSGPGGAGGGSAGSPGASGSAGANAVAGGGGAAGSSGSAGTTPGGSAGAGGAGSAVEPTFAMLKGVIQTSCWGSVCHDLSEHTLPMKIDDKLYTTLTTHVTKTCGPLVKSGSPQDSALVKLLKGPCGKTDRMPYGKCNQDGDEGCISPDIIAAIEKWIANGAPP